MFEVYCSLLFPKPEQHHHSSVLTDAVPLENLPFYSNGLPLFLMLVILGSISTDTCIQSKRKFEILDQSVSPCQGILTAFNFLLQVPYCCSFSLLVWAKAVELFCNSLLLRTFLISGSQLARGFTSSSHISELTAGFLICPDTVAAQEVLCSQVCITCN